MIHPEEHLPCYLTEFTQGAGLVCTRGATPPVSLDTRHSIQPFGLHAGLRIDVWGITVHSAAASSTPGFYPCIIIITHQQHVGRHLWAQHGPSHQVNHEASSGESRAPAS